MTERDESIKYQETGADPGRTARRAYRRPTLRALGEIRTLTLGASPGTGESAGGEIRYFNSGV